MSNETISSPNADALMNEKENKAAPSQSEWNTWDNHNRDAANNIAKLSHPSDVSIGTNDTQLTPNGSGILTNSGHTEPTLSNVAFAEAVAIRNNHQRTESDLSLTDINECLKTLSMNPNNNNNRFGISADDFVNRPMSQNVNSSTRDGERGRESYPPSKSKLTNFETEFQY